MGPFTYLPDSLSYRTEHLIDLKFPKVVPSLKVSEAIHQRTRRRLDNENLFLRLAQLGPQNVSFTCS